LSTSKREAAPLIGIGVVGYGYWGPNLARNFTELPDACVVHICDAREERLALARRRHPGVTTTAQYGELIDDPRVDAVAIATPVSSHFDLAMAALRSGRHVLIEKPLATTLEHGAEMVAEAARRRLVLLVDHTFVYTGAVRRIRQLVADGGLGDLYYCDSVRINLGVFQPDVNVMWDLAVHDLAIMDYALGRAPRAVSATGKSHVLGKSEDVGYLTLFFDGDFIGHIHASWLSPVKVRRMLIGGSQRMIVYDDVEPSEKVKVYDHGVWVENGEAAYDLLVSYRTGDVWVPQLDPTEALRTECQEFVRCIRNGARPASDGEAGLRVLGILEAATRSARGHGQPVEIQTI
jgi:predicted dehydrogenase